MSSARGVLHPWLNQVQPSYGVDGSNKEEFSSHKRGGMVNLKSKMRGQHDCTKQDVELEEQEMRPPRLHRAAVIHTAWMVAVPAKEEAAAAAVGAATPSMSNFSPVWTCST